MSAWQHTLDECLNALIAHPGVSLLVIIALAVVFAVLGSRVIQYLLIFLAQRLTGVDADVARTIARDEAYTNRRRTSLADLLRTIIEHWRRPPPNST